MHLYRLCRRKYAELSGLGAKQTGGRWNRKGVAALYTAENASLAVLEVLVRLDKSEIPADFVLLETTVPDRNILRRQRIVFPGVKPTQTAIGAGIRSPANSLHSSTPCSLRVEIARRKRVEIRSSPVAYGLVSLVVRNRDGRRSRRSISGGIGCRISDGVNATNFGLP